MSVAERIAEALTEIDALQGKDKKIEGGASYRYLSDEQVTEVVHNACAVVKLAIIPIGMTILDEREDTTRNGAIMRNVRLGVDWLIMDGKSGESQSAYSIGEGSDMGDKVMNKCMTAARKYLFRLMFQIGSTDDPDHAASEETTSSNRRPQDRQSQRPPSPKLTGKPAANTSGVPALKDIMRAMEERGLLKPGDDGNSKATDEAFRLIATVGVPKKWGEWDEEQRKAVMKAVTEYDPFENE